MKDKNSWGHRWMLRNMILSFIGLTSIKASTLEIIGHNNTQEESKTMKIPLAIVNQESLLESENDLLKNPILSGNLKQPYFLLDEQDTALEGIDKLIGNKVTFSSVIGDPTWFLSADMRTFNLRMYKYVNPKQSFTRFDERHWQVILTGTHCGIDTYRLQYVLAPGFSKTSHSLACLERNGSVHLGLATHHSDPIDRANMEWFIFGNNKQKGVFLKNHKYDLYLQGSSDNTLSLTSCPTEQGLRWRAATVDNYSRTIIALRETNSDMTTLSNVEDEGTIEYLDFCCFYNARKKSSESIEVDFPKKPRYISVNINRNSLDFSNTLTTPTRYPVAPVGWKSVTNDDSTLTLLSTSVGSVQRGSVTMTATPVKQKDKLYPPIGLYTANKSNASGQFWAAIPVTSGSDQYNLYLRDSANDASPLMLSLRHNKIVLSPQNLFQNGEVLSDTVPLQVAVGTVTMSNNDYATVMETALKSPPVSVFLPGNNSYGRGMWASLYNSISSNDQTNIITNSGVYGAGGLLALRSDMGGDLSKIAYGAALLISSYAQKWNLQQYQQNPSSIATAAPACAIAWYSNGNNGSSYSTYVLMTDENKIVNAYNPATTNSTNVLQYSSNPTTTVPFPDAGMWNPAFE